jgi:hypothetical protein
MHDMIRVGRKSCITRGSAATVARRAREEPRGATEPGARKSQRRQEGPAAPNQDKRARKEPGEGRKQPRKEPGGARRPGKHCVAADLRITMPSFQLGVWIWKVRYRKAEHSGRKFLHAKPFPMDEQGSQPLAFPSQACVYYIWSTKLLLL